MEYISKKVAAYGQFVLVFSQEHPQKIGKKSRIFRYGFLVKGKKSQGAYSPPPPTHLRVKLVQP